MEAKNLVLTAEVVTQAALAREESRSAQIRSDFPKRDNKWIKNVCVTNQNGNVAISTIPVVLKKY
jgi:succinate dehydrogenase/fumarate reductase flavoprotein subunit